MTIHPLRNVTGDLVTDGSELLGHVVGGQDLVFLGSNENYLITHGVESGPRSTMN